LALLVSSAAAAAAAVFFVSVFALWTSSFQSLLHFSTAKLHLALRFVNNLTGVKQ